MDLPLVNRHWNEGFVYPFPKTRDLYTSLCKALEGKFILSVIGLRRTGKTTLLKQLINYLIGIRGIKPGRILFYTFDDPAELGDILDSFAKRANVNLAADHCFIFLDEIQKVEDWQNKVKIYYDHYPNLKFVVSGSSSLFIRKTSESLAGRLLEFVLHPLSFREYLLFKGKETLAKEGELLADERLKEFEKYSSEQFIDIIGESEETKQEYLDSLCRKVIFEDIPLLYPVHEPQVIWKIFKIIRANPGMLLDYHNLASDLGIHERTLSSYVDTLSRSFMILKLYNYSRNQISTERKLRKVYPCSSALCESTLPARMETLVVTQLRASFFWRRGYEVDCVIIADGAAVPIEVKYGAAIKERDLKGIKKFMEVFKVPRGTVLTKDTERVSGSLHFIPCWKFLLQT